MNSIELPGFLNCAEVDIPEVLSDFGTGVASISLVDTIDAFLAPPLCLFLPLCAALYPFSPQLRHLYRGITQVLLTRSFLCLQPLPFPLPFPVDLPLAYPPA